VAPRAEPAGKGYVVGRSSAVPERYGVRWPRRTPYREDDPGRISVPPSAAARRAASDAVVAGI